MFAATTCRRGRHLPSSRRARTTERRGSSATTCVSGGSPSRSTQSPVARCSAPGRCVRGTASVRTVTGPCRPGPPGPRSRRRLPRRPAPRRPRPATRRPNRAPTSGPFSLACIRISVRSTRAHRDRIVHPRSPCPRQPDARGRAGRRRSDRPALRPRRRRAHDRARTPQPVRLPVRVVARSRRLVAGARRPVVRAAGRLGRRGPPRREGVRRDLDPRRARRQRVRAAPARAARHGERTRGRHARRHHGRAARRASAKPFVVFTPYYDRWLRDAVARACAAPRRIAVPDDLPSERSARGRAATRLGRGRDGRTRAAHGVGHARTARLRHGARRCPAPTQRRASRRICISAASRRRISAAAVGARRRRRSSSGSCAGATSSRSCCGGDRRSRTTTCGPASRRCGERARRRRGVEGGAHRLPVRRRRDAPAARRGLDAQPGAHGRGIVPHHATCASTGAKAPRISWTCSSTATSRTISSTGSGSPGPAPTRTRTASSTRPCKVDVTIPKGTYIRRWVTELADAPGRRRRPRSAVRHARARAATPSRSSTTPKPSSSGARA